MGEFRRISDCDDPMEVLAAPMEIGLIPEPSDWLAGWQTEYCDESLIEDSKSTSYHDCESELFDRYSIALPLNRRIDERSSFYLEDLDGALAGRDDAAELVTLKYPGLQLESAMRAYEDQYSYHALSPRQQAKFDRLVLLRRVGYALPRPPSELMCVGTQRAPIGCKHSSRRIARKVAEEILSGSATTKAIECGITRTREGRAAIECGRSNVPYSKGEAQKLEDTIKKAPVKPWPKAIFDGVQEGGTWDAPLSMSSGQLFPPRYRYILLHKASRSAFERAFLKFCFERRVIVHGDRATGNWIAATKPA